MDDNKQSEFDTKKIEAQLRVWRERLLDLSKGNPLLGINRSRVSKLSILDSGNNAKLFKSLVLEEVSLKMPLVTKKVKKKRDKKQKDKEEIAEEVEPEYTVIAGDVNFNAEPSSLYRLIRRIYDNSKSTVEERGVTTLHLTFGVLKWEDGNLGESESPLLLIPCELESNGPNSHMRLKMLDEELQVNPALELFLRERHKVILPTFSEEPNDDSLNDFLQQVRTVIKQEGWTIEDKSWLSTFTFESLVLYKDLEAMAPLALIHPIIAALSRAGKINDVSLALGEDLDVLETPNLVPIPVMDADSSQLKALTIAGAGKHLVIHGPPGTGKSQTITNLIAHALGEGKKVLFVSAKMAALNVVHERLVQLGLGRFCLEAHSTKSGKAKIIDELKKTIELPSPSGGAQFDQQLEDLKKVRSELNSYIDEINCPVQPLGKTIYQAIGKLEKYYAIPLIDFDLPWIDVLEVSDQQLRERINVLQDLATQHAIFDSMENHPWRGFTPGDERPKTDVIKKSLQLITANFDEVKVMLQDLSYLLSPQNEVLRLKDINELKEVLNLIAISNGLPKGWITMTEKELDVLEKLFEVAINKSEQYESLEAKYEKVTKLSPGELYELLLPLKNEFASWTCYIKPDFWKWRASVRRKLEHGLNFSYSSLRSYCLLAEEMKEIEAWFRTHEEALDQHVTDSIRNISLLKEKIMHFRTAKEIKIAILNGVLQKPTTEVLEIPENDRKKAFTINEALNNNDLVSAISAITLSWPEGFVEGSSIHENSLHSVIDRSNEILGALTKLHEWNIFQSLVVKCKELDLSSFLYSIIGVGAKQACEIFEKRFYHLWVEANLDLSPTLKNLIGSLLGERVVRFKELDLKLRASMLKRIQVQASAPVSRITSAHDGFGSSGEIGILRKELNKRKRIKPLRKLFAEIPHVLQALKPCMLMSPISVSTFLKPDDISFDLVVFDEASQLPPQEAIPSILRGKQIVVAGDENQLPPTSFFLASSIFEDEETETDDDLVPLESLLDDCVAIEPVFQRSKIIWHYRSKDERLIKFSNHFFYNNSLITFPSASTSNDGRGIELVYTEDGTWDRGRSRTNRVEARRVAEIVIEQLSKFPDRSIGVVSMNGTQKEAIENCLDELTLQRPELLALLDSSRKEPFFVKSLENVQGDERDTIIISVGYAKSPQGALSLNFGPLNREGGWRRLNVLVTRAKWQTILVTSVRSQELSGISPVNKGACMLRNFIEYAERDARLPEDIALVTNEETNDFEDSVATELRSRGFLVDEQVGASGYRIDLAVRDPRDTNRYIMAIECDGATYHSGVTARDRDLLRQEVLQSQGWKIYRLWSTDWFRDRESALQEVLEAIDTAKKYSVNDSIQAAPLSSLVGEEKEYEEKEQNMEIRPKRTYQPGIPYEKYQIHRKSNSKILMNESQASKLADVIARIVDVESPMHTDVIIERLKEYFGVSRAGANIQRNTLQAIKWACISHHLKINKKFIYRDGNRYAKFRISNSGSERSLLQIPPEEIENAVLYIVEDQFGFAREHIAKAVLNLFGLGKNWTEPLGTIEKIVDGLLESGQLKLSGYTLYLG